MKLLPLLLCASSLFATVNEPLRWEVFTGYRNDRIHWHLQDPGDESAVTYRELYRDVEFWENGLNFRVIHRDLTFFARGAYGTFGRGTLDQRYSHLSYTSEEPQFQFNTEGWSADGSGYFGYAVNLTADRTYKTILLPLIGYSAHFERLQRKQGTPALFEGTGFTLQSELPKDFRLSFWGLLLGVGFIIEPGGEFVFNGGWSYHWLHSRVHTAASAQFTAGGVTGDDSFSFKATNGGNMGQSGWVQMDYLLSRYWRMGIGGQIHYFSTKVMDMKLQPAEIAQKLKLRWTTVSGWFQISREF